MSSMRPYAIMAALAALMAAPVALGCYVVSQALPKLNAVLAAIGG